ncbi:hypothetical protein WG66_014589 [Moniliophthora roreri]|nr:hypothetical protein WG66_001158 [Moniliophthora roreri]KAI3612707.1 hypothetical protein WG66_014589 [Moniliophthora roreri]
MFNNHSDKDTSLTSNQSGPSATASYTPAPQPISYHHPLTYFSPSAMLFRNRKPSRPSFRRICYTVNEKSTNAQRDLMHDARAA